MISSWKRRMAARRAGKGQPESEMELSIPKDLQCPISLELMKDPVTLSTGITYDRENIEKWIEDGNVTCPITNQKLSSVEPIPNHAIRQMIQNWCVENRFLGIERIPTPRTPVNSAQVLEIQAKINSSVKGDDHVGCRNLVAKTKTLMNESERNKRCIVSNCTASVLSAAFLYFSRSNYHEKASVLEEILSSLTLMFPLEGEAKSYLGSSSSMDCLVWILKGGDLSGRRNAVLVLKEVIISLSDQRKVETLSGIEGAIEALVKLIKEPICPTATKASLVTIYHMVTQSNAKTITNLAEMGIVQMLIEIVVDSEKSVYEKALGVLDGMCSWDEGRSKLYDHCLSIPVTVKKIHRVSEIATEFAVSILWKLCKNEKKEGRSVVVEALQVGAFQKLLLLLQVGSDEITREKATELLKLLNPHRERSECIDFSDFKNLKRPF